MSQAAAEVKRTSHWLSKAKIRDLKALYQRDADQHVLREFSGMVAADHEEQAPG
jgi:hypothetical protein